MGLHLICRLDWVLGCLGIWSLETSGVFVGEFLDDICVAAGHGEADGPASVLKV